MEFERRALRDIEDFQALMQGHLAGLQQARTGFSQRVLLKTIWTESELKALRRGVYCTPKDRKFSRLSSDKFNTVAEKFGLNEKDRSALVAAYQRYLVACDAFHSVRTPGRLRSSLNPDQAEKRMEALLLEEGLDRSDLRCFLTFLAFATSCIQRKRDRGSVRDAWTNGLAIHYAFRRDQNNFPLGEPRMHYLTLVNELNGQTAFMAGDMVAMKRIVADQKRVVEENPSWRARYVLVAIEHDLAVSTGAASGDTPAIRAASMLKETDQTTLEADAVDLEIRICFELARARTPLDASIALFGGERLYSAILRCRRNARRMDETNMLYRCYHALSVASNYDLDVRRDLSARRKMLRLRASFVGSSLYELALLGNLIDFGALSFPEISGPVREMKESFDRRKITLPLRVVTNGSQKRPDVGARLSVRGVKRFRFAGRALRRQLVQKTPHLMRIVIAGQFLGRLTPMIETLVDPANYDDKAPEILNILFSAAAEAQRPDVMPLQLVQRYVTSTGANQISDDLLRELPIDDKLKRLGIFRKRNVSEADLAMRVARAALYKIIAVVRNGRNYSKNLLLKGLGLSTGSGQQPPGATVGKKA